MDTRKQVLIQRNPKDPTLLTPAIPITEEEAKKLPPDQVIRVDEKTKIYEDFGGEQRSPEEEKALADQVLIRKFKKQRDEFENLWHEARSIGGKMYWDGAQHGYVWGLNGQSGYGIDKRISETARDVSILIARDDVPEDIKKNLDHLTFMVIKYNTNDEILFQYVAGKPKVIRIKTHDGLTCEPDKPLVKNFQGNIYKSLP